MKKFTKETDKRESRKGSKSKGNPRNLRTGDRHLADDQRLSKCTGADNHPNDIAWYSKNPELLSSASNISYLTSTGSRLLWNDAALEDATIAVHLTSVPGIMALNFVAGPGVCSNSTDPVNIAANNIYTFIRNTNSGGKNYDAPDLMMYLLAMDSLYMCYNHIKRVYGVATTYSAVNKYLPTELIKAMGITPASVFDNMANVRTRLNILAAKLASFAVPTTMPYFLRHSWMTSNVYLDADNAKAGIYVFNPHCFHQFSETANEQGGSLEIVEMGTYVTQMDVNLLIEKLDTAINRMLYSYDVGTISGDIMKAYKDSGLFTVGPVEDSYSVTPVYNEEVLLQIHNSTAHSINLNSTLNITQDPDTNNIVWQPTSPYERESSVFKRPINMRVLTPTAADTMIATRLISCVDGGGSAYATCGTEIIVNYYVIQIQYKSGGVEGATAVFTSNQPVDAATLSLLSQFDWHPIITPVTVVTSGSAYTLDNVYGDLNVFALADVEFINNVNEVALLSLFNVPQVGKF